MIPENTYTPLKADCPSAPCSASSCECAKCVGYRRYIDWKKMESELTAARAEIERLDTAGIHSCHNDCQRLPCVLRRERDEARRLAEKYRNLSCDSQDEADETLLPWKTINPNEL